MSIRVRALRSCLSIFVFTIAAFVVSVAFTAASAVACGDLHSGDLYSCFLYFWRVAKSIIFTFNSSLSMPIPLLISLL